MERLSRPEGDARVRSRLPSHGAISFTYLAEIAVGQTARVDLCRAVGGPKDGLLLAVKRLHPHIAEDPGFATQFLDEVWMTASLKHPNVVEVQGWGTDSQGSYLAVELVQGVSLARLMKTVFDTGEIFSERMVVYIGSRLCRGLGAAHALENENGELLHLVHRDLTPGNVLCGFNGDVKIADFGLAKAKQRLTKTLTGLLKGQPTYMAPEQASGREIDSRADLFSLGVVLFELFAGRRPWLAGNDFDMVQQTTNFPPADLKELRPKMDKELVNVVLGCLEKDPSRRFQNAEEVRARLEGWLEVHGYSDGNEETLARFVRRNAMRQMRWFERAVAGDLAPMPDSMRPQLRPRPPKSPSYTNNPPEARSTPSSKRRYGSFKPPIDNEATDVNDPGSKIAQAAAEAPPPVIREAPGLEDDIDWSEEIPTVVQKNGRERQLVQEALARAAAAKKAPEKEPIVDDDSENRTTAVKKAKPRLGVAIADMDSEEMPTVPVKGIIEDAETSKGGRGIEQKTAPARPVPAAPASMTALSPKRDDSRALPGSVVPPSAGVPPVPSRRMTPSPMQAANDGGHYAREHATPDALSSRTGASESANGVGLTTGPLDPSLITEALLVQEADRLAIEAVRRNDEAKSAAARAERKATMAKMASDAALIAAEAVRLAAVAGLSAAALRLEEARAIEAALQHGAVPPSNASSGSQPPPPRMSQPPMPSQLPPQLPSMPPLPPVPSMTPAGPLRSAAALQSSAPPGFYAQHDPRFAASTGDGPLAASSDDAMFRSRLKAGAFGMPTALVLGLAAAAFLLMLIVLWLVLG